MAREVPLSEEYADHTEATQNGIIRKLDEHVKMKFKTGGSPGSTRKNLYVLSGTLNGGASPPQAMSLGSLGHLKRACPALKSPCLTLIIPC
jgi:hypothetical protein